MNGARTGGRARSAKPTAVEALIGRGVEVRKPSSVEVGPEVDPARVAPGVVIHAGCRLRGAATSIGPGCEIGLEGPATVEDCQLASNVRLRGGYFAGSVFMDGASMGSSAHIRPGCIVEEGAGAGHCVGLKQTILFPFVTGGSLINFCDVLMAGGTGPEDHGEIGSSYVHFNFTPRGDKATASLLGDVPRGVMLDQRPIFLGGQGGIVGPVRVEYGCLAPAGTILRRDAVEPSRLVMCAGPSGRGSGPYEPAVITNAARLVANCVRYIANIHALDAWYAHARPAPSSGHWNEACHAGARSALKLVLEERTRRLGELAGMFGESARLLRERGVRDEADSEVRVQMQFAKRWASLSERLLSGPGDSASRRMEAFLSGIAGRRADGYVQSLKSLPRSLRAAGTAWLQEIVDGVISDLPGACGGRV